MVVSCGRLDYFVASSHGSDQLQQPDSGAWLGQVRTEGGECSEGCVEVFGNDYRNISAPACASLRRAAGIDAIQHSVLGRLNDLGQLTQQRQRVVVG